MEKSQVRELINEILKRRGGELEAVEIYGGDGGGREIIRRVVAVEAFVVAYIWTNPC